MARIKKEWIEDGAIDQSKIVLTAKLNDESTAAPTADIELSNKKYVDDEIASAIAALPAVPPVFERKGNWDASTNTPTLANTDTSVDGFLYYVNVAGSQDFGAGSETFSVGDWVYNVNGAWEKADNNDDVLSVNGQVGAVTLDTDDISEGATNLYFTVTRARVSAVVNSTAGSESDQAPSVVAMKGYVAGEIAGVSQAFRNQVRTLTAGEASGNSLILPEAPLAGSLHVTPEGGPPQVVGNDFSVSGTTLTLLGDLATYAVAGTRLIIHYAY